MTSNHIPNNIDGNLHPETHISVKVSIHLPKAKSFTCQLCLSFLPNKNFVSHDNIWKIVESDNKLPLNNLNVEPF